MKSLLLAASLLAAAPALALQIPVPGKADPHVCDVKYDPNEVTNVIAVMGNTVSIRFGDKERIDKVAPSDTVHLKYFLTEGGNLLWLKGTQEMPAQPIAVRTITEGGAPRDYVLQWAALAEPPKPPPQQVASLATVKIDEVPPDQAVNFCYLIRYNYPNEVSAAQIAAWRQQQARKKADEAEIALRRAEAAKAVNVHYVARGDASIGPRATGDHHAIYDDGYTTTLEFPGNMRIPVILTKTPDGKESEVNGFTVEQAGVVKIHQVLPFIQLRDGDLTLCIYNRAYNPVGNNPGSGTTEPAITRSVDH